MTNFNRVAYGIAFGALFCSLATSIMMIIIGENNITPKMDKVIANSLQLNLGIVVIGVLLTRYKSTDKT